MSTPLSAFLGAESAADGHSMDTKIFDGSAKFKDYWDFDAKPWDTWVTGKSNRTTAGELKTWAGATMEGQPFWIHGPRVNIYQHQFDSQADIT